MSINKFVPIAIHTLNRYNHFKRCIESLQQCKYANQTELYIAIDYPSKEAHWDGYNKILNYIPTIEGFKEVFLYKREYNFGARNNSITLTEDVFQKHDIIFKMEDDNEFSPNTLEYLNLSLKKYKDDPSIYCICCSHHQIEMPKKISGSYFKIDSYSPFGVAFWRDKSIKYYDVNKYIYIKSFLKKYSNYKKYKKDRLYLISSLVESISRDYFLGDGLLTVYIIENQMKCIMPTVHKVRNHGHDGSGLHCADIGANNKYVNRVIDTDYNFQLIEEDSNEVIDEIRSTILQHFKEPFIKRLFQIVRYHIYYLFNYTFKVDFFRKVYREYTK